MKLRSMQFSMSLIRNTGVGRKSDLPKEMIHSAARCEDSDCKRVCVKATSRASVQKLLRGSNAVKSENRIRKPWSQLPRGSGCHLRRSRLSKQFCSFDITNIKRITSGWRCAIKDAASRGGDDQ